MNFLQQIPHRGKRLRSGPSLKWNRIPTWVFNILWTDEAHFSLHGDVNNHNCRIWATSNPRLGLIIDILSGLVIDFEVLWKYCHNCVIAGRDMGVDSAEFHIWQKGHADECDKNFDGTSGAMEMPAALIM
ncbi:uncharacterized protein TNCV_3211491 [Trichonephila clavipes]|uniref:Uncharacterized protein n=1 Tax=Trichonephila clavipes TaxID=2585209 RepID=A0A8X6RX60_TRICX|nr:uncharacterized protein TNCV_3211491 [Trichonephila clavipes]